MSTERHFAGWRDGSDREVESGKPNTNPRRPVCWVKCFHCGQVVRPWHAVNLGNRYVCRRPDCADAEMV